MTTLITAPTRRQLVAGLGAAMLLSPARAQTAAPAIERSRKAGPNLYEIVASAAQDQVYVASVGPRGANQAQILALDPRTLEQRAAIPLTEAAFGLGLNDRAGMIYGTSTILGKVVVVDLGKNEVVASIGGGPERAHLREAAVDTAANRVFVSDFGARDRPSCIWVIDGATNRLDHVITEGLAAGGITGLALGQGGKLYATAMSSHEIVEIDLARRAAVRRFAAGGEGPTNIAFDSAGGRLFVANQRSGDVSVLNAGDGSLIRAVKTGEGALGVTFSAGTQRLFVANRRGGTVSVLDTRSLDVLANLPTGTHPNTVAVDPRNGLAYVANKARTGERGAPPPEDPNGDVVALIR